MILSRWSGLETTRKGDATPSHHNWKRESPDYQVKLSSLATISHPSIVLRRLPFRTEQAYVIVSMAGHFVITGRQSQRVDQHRKRAMDHTEQVRTGVKDTICCSSPPVNLGLLYLPLLVMNDKSVIQRLLLSQSEQTNNY